MYYHNTGALTIIKVYARHNVYIDTVTGASSSFVVGGLAFGISIGVLILIILLITVILVTVLAIFIRSKKNTATTAQAHQSDSFNISKDSSSHIDTKRNLAYEPVHFRTISAT